MKAMLVSHQPIAPLKAAPWRAAIVLLGTFLLLVAVTAAPVMAQEKGTVRVNIGFAAGKPGDPIDVPVTLSGAEAVQVGRVLLHIGYPKYLLKYTGTEPGLAVELAEGDVEVSLADDPMNSSQTVLEFSATGTKCLKPGIIGYLKFTISNEAQKGSIVLKLEDSKAPECNGGDLAVASGEDGQITVFASDEEIPAVGCFFFTH